MPHRSTVTLVAAALSLALACTTSDVQLAPSAMAGASDRIAEVVAAGDIACAGDPCAAQRGTARLIGRLHPDAVLALGDLQYPDGSLSDFRSSYDRTWGRYRRITHPVPGNHEYMSSGSANGYFTYWGARAHPGSRGTYSFHLKRWYVVAVNTGDRPPGRSELRRIARGLRRDHHRCELAYWHQPRWSSGRDHGTDSSYDRLWRTLYSAGVDVVLNGHDHIYERFTPLTPAGNPSRDGIREFVVGTGGNSLDAFAATERGSEVRRLTYGLLWLKLQSASYKWKFMDTHGRTHDDGVTRCHR